MQTERLGHYDVELSARQLIHNGGWAAFAAIHAPADEAQHAAFDEAHAASPMHGMLDEAVFASEADAIAGAREAVLAFIRMTKQRP
jgi:hypothetical protein